MLPRILALAIAAMLASLSPSAAEPIAKEIFGARTDPAPLEARAIGTYARGCLAGARMLAVDGPAWQVMRLSRNRNWGHPSLLAMLERLAATAPSVGWRGLLVGDLAQPRGGPMLTGHTSHQVGLDADIWLTPMPDRRLSAQERETISARTVLRDPDAGPQSQAVDPNVWTPSHGRIIEAAARDGAVERIFVHPAIKAELCRVSRGASWLSKVRPWYGHHYHFHIRIACPAGESGCERQAPVPAGDGCGDDLAWWFTDGPYRPADPAAPPRRELTLADLPAACRQVAVE